MRVKDASQKFLGIWIRNLLKGDPILVFGDSKQLWDFNYVDQWLVPYCVLPLPPVAMPRPSTLVTEK